jgi:hypothetical protein
MARLQLLRADHPCADEENDLDVPAYSRWQFTQQQQVIIPQTCFVKSSQDSVKELHSIVLSIDTPPPRV